MKNSSIRFRVTMIGEYSAYPPAYGTADPTEMAKIDEAQAPEDILSIILNDNNIKSFSLKIEPVDDV